MELNKYNTALIVVDMQDNFSNEYFRKEDLEKVTRAHEQFFNSDKTKGMSVYNVSSKEYGKTLPDFIELFSGIKEHITNILKKPGADSAFTNPKLISNLKKKGIDNLIISGGDANYCVKSTAEMAKINGYNIHSSPDMVMTKKDEPGIQAYENTILNNGILYDDIDDLLSEFG